TVEMLGLECVVEHVGANRLVVGPITRYAIDVVQLLAAMLNTGTELVAAMRLVPAVPEAKRLVCRLFVEKRDKIGRVVGVRHRTGRRRRFPLLIRFACQLPRLAHRVGRDSGSPTFSGRSDEVAVRGKNL